MNLKDGKYITSPKWGKTLRTVEIKDGVAHINGYRFSQEDFFEVNNLIKEVRDDK
jgi:hypothetical protein